jgi:hypothetical protein
LIYFVLHPRARAVKIGYADDPEKRIRSLQTANPDRLKPLGVIPGSMALEKMLHFQFAPHRIRGEWFRFTRDVASRIAALIAEKSSRPAPLPLPDREKEYRAIVGPIAERISRAVGFPSGIAWGAEPWWTGTRSRPFSYQVMPEPGYDFGDQPSADFWWWHIEENEQWFPTPDDAADAFILAWRYWNDRVRGMEIR